MPTQSLWMKVLVRVPQRNRTNQIDIQIDRYEGGKEGRNKKIYYKELTFAIMIAEKSQELQLVETQKSRWFTASLNLLKTRRANSVSCSPSLRLKAGQEQVFQLEGWQRERERERVLSPFILFRLSRLDEPHPH